jgi:hypothetical protein
MSSLDYGSQVADESVSGTARPTLGNVALAVALYLSLAIAFTWPAAIRPYETVVGDADALGGIWWAWARLNGLIDVFHCTKLVAWPEGNCGPMPSQPISEYLILFFSWLTNEIFGSILFIVFSLVASAITAFVVLARRGVDPLVAVWGGALVGFNSPALAQVLGGHAVYALAVPVIIFLDKLELVWSEAGSPVHRRPIELSRSLRNGAVLGMWLGLIFAVSIYSGYFLSVFVAIVGVGALIRAIAKSRSFSELTAIQGARAASFTPIWISIAPYCFSLFVAAIIAFGCNALIVAHALGLLPAQLSQSGGFFSRSASELAEFGARPADYLRPFPWHPIWGDLFNIQRILPPLRGNAYETSLFPGLLVILTSGAGFARYRKTDQNDPLRRLFQATAVFTAIMASLSLATEISIGGVFDVPILSQFLFSFAPMFRVYARCGIFVAMGLGVLGAISTHWFLKLLINRISSQSSKVVLPIISVLLFATSSELLPTSPGRATSTTLVNYPGKILELALNPNAKVVVHYPIFQPDELAHYRYLFWQRIHKKAMINGTHLLINSQDQFKQNLDPSDPLTQQLLRSQGVTHIVIHSVSNASDSIPPEIVALFPKNNVARDIPFPRPYAVDRDPIQVISLLEMDR